MWARHRGVCFVGDEELVWCGSFCDPVIRFSCIRQGATIKPLLEVPTWVKLPEKWSKSSTKISGHPLEICPKKNGIVEHKWHNPLVSTAISKLINHFWLLLTRSVGLEREQRKEKRRDKRERERERERKVECVCVCVKAWLFLLAKVRLDLRVRQCKREIRKSKLSRMF